jgi:hypothetical protein
MQVLWPEVLLVVCALLVSALVRGKQHGEGPASLNIQAESTP